MPSWWLFVLLPPVIVAVLVAFLKGRRLWMRLLMVTAIVAVCTVALVVGYQAYVGAFGSLEQKATLPKDLMILVYGVAPLQWMLSAAAITVVHLAQQFGRKPKA